MSSGTYHTTEQDIRKQESRESQIHGGKTDKGGNASALKSMVEDNTDKAKEIDDRKANLPLPEQPPAASDLKSMNANTVNVGWGGRVEGDFKGDTAFREPATAASSVRESGDELHKTTAPMADVGRQGKDNLQEPPKDARAR